MSNITLKTKYLTRALIFTMFVLLGYSSYAQVKAPFSPRFSDKVNGDFTMIANNVVSEHPTNAYNGSSNNNSISSVFVDIDTDTSTFNSSSANLVNPSPASACLTFRRAYLYWAAANKENGPDNNGNMTGNGNPEVNWPYNQVKLMLPGSSSYTTLTADEVIYNGRAEHFVNDPYVCVKDITAQVQALTNPYGKFQVANVKATIGDLWEHLDVGQRNTGTSGGWQIVFIYESPQLRSRNVTLFDGYANVTADDNEFDVLFDGFQTVPNGPVNANIVAGSIEGDRGIDGDQLQIFDTKGNWTSLSTDERDQNNFFNSKITVNETPFLSRNPASTNTLGFDASTFELRNNGRKLIDNDQTSATLRLTSDQETYGLYLLGLSIEVFEPSLGALSFTTNVIGSNFDPGDNAPVEIRVKNVGNDNIQNLEIALTLPAQVEFLSTEPLPPGVTYNFDTTTRELRFFVEDGYTDVTDPEYELDFNLFVNNECVTCSAAIGLQAMATFTGETNPNMVGTLSSGTVDACGIGNHDPTILTVTPVLSIEDGSGTEGGNIVFDISSSHLLAEDALLNLAYTNNTASSSDYTILNTYTVPTGTGNTSFSVASVEDSIIENPETFDIVASSTANITLLDNTATGTINDNDASGPGEGISVADFTVNESVGTADFVISYTGPTVEDSFTVDFLVNDGEPGAELGLDFTINGVADRIGSVTFPANTADGATQNVTLPILDDNIIEPTETLTIDITGISIIDIIVIDNTGIGTITDNDNAAPGDGISFSNAALSVVEGNTAADNTQLSFTVTYTGTIPAGETVSVDYATVVGSADGSDFVEIATQTLQFTEISKSLVIDVDVLEDTVIESDEDFTVVLSNITTANGFVTGFVDGATTNTATGTILNDDNAGAGDGIIVSDFSVNEDIGAVDFVITYTGPTVQNAFTIDFEITDGSAISPDDYTVITAIGNVSFPANAISGATQTVTVTIIDDLTSEITEDLNITLSNSTNTLVTIVDPNGVGTILDNDMGEIMVEAYEETITIICGEEVPEAPTLIFTGGCGNYVVDFTEVEEFSTDTDDFSIVRTWNVSDVCGNTASFQQVIFVLQRERSLIELDICIEDEAIDLIDFLPEGFDTNGSFTFAAIAGNATLSGSQFDPNGLELGEYQISYESTAGSCKYFADLIVNVNADCLPCNVEDLVVSKTITVNGDGINDFFEISGLENCGYTYNVKIFNRWGSMVYESQDYQNNWGGNAPGGSFGSNAVVPSGTYYYIIALSDPEIKPVNGYIYIGSN